MITVRVNYFSKILKRYVSLIETIPLDTPMMMYSKTFLPHQSYEILSVEY